MSPDRIDIAEALSKLTPAERAEAEDLLVEKVLRDAKAARRLRDPEAAEVAEAHAREIVKALADPLPPGAEEKVRAAVAAVARVILAEDGKP